MFPLRGTRIVNALVKMLLLVPLLVAPAGCASIGLPNLFHPGHIDDQRARMAQYDPYTNVGPGPNIDGDRPEGFAVPGAPERRFEGYPKGTTGFP